MSTSGIPRWLQIFIPTKEVKATPIILSANVLMWLIMVLSGVSPLLPSTEEMRTWGGTSTLDVTNGDYWRLFTSNYLHYGIIHLAANMFSFNNIGRMLEQFIGTWRFALIYTMSGILGSAVSIWWNPYGLGAGASGAVLGTVGILLALLTTNLIEKKVRMSMLRSMAISAGLMVLISMQGNIDNAAHLGGLAAGMLGGYFIYPELKAYYYQRKKQYIGLVAACLLTAGACGWFVMNAESGPSILELTQEFDREELMIDSSVSSGQYKTAEEIRTEVVEFYNLGIQLTEMILEDVETPEAKDLYIKKKNYLIARKKYYEFVALDKEKNISISDSTQFWARASDSLLKRVNSR